ncbi:DUF6541 family protein [Actinoalloteichus hymeniacidonis]|uniref:Uncharacterized protein n=1 Tax=Actinoalloteichus hymeniacidonis TaxID=340345 RepID=A0AAC9HK96_9PSEU|nr:DUF6541 family protein [Actinoalloteichus hymeniacidonis]AOS60987.1 hypothetical protein TL08_00695 [Actinoalloteichus hymeniacidonis]MBB5911013.1 hypothetical protein [Actinoalloteichus hymeniacidonis]
MSWLEAVPTALIAVGWLLLPGLLLGYAAGFRGIPAWGAAPVASIALIGTLAVAAGAVGLTWGPAIVAGGTVIAAVLVLAVRLLIARRAKPKPTEQDPWSVRIAALIGILLAVPIGVVTVMAGMGEPDRLVQSFDAVFHLNAITFILEEGNASSLAVGGTTDPLGDGGFYPAAFHALASLTESIAGVGVHTVANLTAVVVALIAWPLSCMLLVRQIVGPSVPAMVLTGLISLGFESFPWMLLGFGVIWPNLVGMAVLPAGLAAVIALTRMTKRVTLGNGQAVLLLLATLAGGGLAHPNSVFSLAAFSIAPVAFAVFRQASRLVSVKRYIPATVLVVVPVVLTIVGGLVFATSSAFAELTSHDWPAFETPSQALGEVAFGGLNRRDATWLLSLAVLIGLVSAWRGRTHRWLVFSHLTAGVLYMFAASLDSGLSMLLTGIWYNDSHRLAAMIPVTAIPLAVIGLTAVARALHRFVAERRWTGPITKLTGSVATLTLLLGALLVVQSGGMYARDHPELIGRLYPETPNNRRENLVDPDERRFYAEVAEIVPEGATVANQPWDGSALLWALEERRVLYPHLVFEWNEDQEYLAENLHEVATDPVACQAVQDQGIEYLISGSLDFWPDDARRELYPGIEAAAGAPGFELVAEDAGLQLYRITDCAAG